MEKFKVLKHDNKFVCIKSPHPSKINYTDTPHLLNADINEKDMKNYFTGKKVLKGTTLFIFTSKEIGKKVWDIYRKCTLEEIELTIKP
jgi:hypothetical protein